MLTSPKALALVCAFLAVTASGCADADSSTPEGPVTSSATSTSSEGTGLSMVVIGDSIPMNAAEDCPGCTGFVDQYAEAAERALGQRVAVTNLAQHTNLMLPDLLAELPDFSDQLAAADIILVGIAHNSFELNADEPCGAPLIDDDPDWAKVTPECGQVAAERYRTDYGELYRRIAALRSGMPTVLRTIDRYDDWRGSDGIAAEDTDRAKSLTDDWDKVICAAATAHGFACVDLHAAMNGADGTQSAMGLLTDGVHPNQRGMDVIARALVEAGFAPLA